MPPKAKPKGKAKAKAPTAAKAPDAQGEIMPATPNFYNPNVEWHSNVQLALDAIRGYFGENIHQEDALSVREGFMAPCDSEELKAKLDDTSLIDPIIMTCGVNILWASPLESLTPNVAVNTSAIEMFIANTWPPGVVRPLNEPIDFRLDSVPFSKGGLTRLSPDEPQHALILQVARRITDGAPADEMAIWKKCLLSATGRFIRVHNYDDMYFWVTNARRRLRDAAAAIVHLASQVICDIWLFKVRPGQHMNFNRYSGL